MIERMQDRFQELLEQFLVAQNIWIVQGVLAALFLIGWFGPDIRTFVQTHIYNREVK